MRFWNCRTAQVFLLGMIILLGLPAATFAQRRRSDRDWRNGSSKKCEKFVNCHDARDGRWDGRGPHRRFSESRHRRHRRDSDDNFYRRQDRRYEDSFYRRRDRQQRYRNDNRYRNDYYGNDYGSGSNLTDLLRIFNP